MTSAAGFTPWVSLDLEVQGGAGGHNQAAGDYWYGDLRRPFAQAGMWGLLRVLPAERCDAQLQPLAGRPCGERPPASPQPEPDPKPDGNRPPTPDPDGAAPVRPPAKRLTKLVVPRRIGLAQLKQRSLSFQVTVPSGVRVLRLSLAPAGGSRGAALHAQDFAVRSAGRARGTYRPPARVTKRLTVGRYVVRMQGGKDRKRLAPGVLERTVVVR